MGRFRFQPPKAYREHTLRSGKRTVYFWVGPGDAPILLFGQAVLTPQEQSEMQVQFRRRLPLVLHTHGFSHLHISPTEAGTIHGLSFRRIHWTGVGEASGAAEGFFYLGQNAGVAIDANFETVKAGGPAAASLAVAEASVLTLQPK